MGVQARIDREQLRVPEFIVLSWLLLAVSVSGVLPPEWVAVVGGVALVGEFVFVSVFDADQPDWEAGSRIRKVGCGGAALLVGLASPFVGAIPGWFGGVSVAAAAWLLLDAATEERLWRRYGETVGPSNPQVPLGLLQHVADELAAATGPLTAVEIGSRCGISSDRARLVCAVLADRGVIRKRRDGYVPAKGAGGPLAGVGTFLRSLLSRLWRPFALLSVSEREPGRTV